jgi:uncharacterized protein YndB with AHSA1/START domain
MMPKSDSATSFQIRRVLDSPRAKVFAAWTQKELLEQWMCRDVPTQRAEYVELDVRPGRRYVIEIKLPAGEMYRGEGIFREVKAPEKLVFTWSWKKLPEKKGEAPAQEHESLVTVELFERGSSTELVLTHELIPSVPERDETERGWEGCFDVLAAVLEKLK